MINQNIFFAIESIGRELDYKLLLAALLLKNNLGIGDALSELEISKELEKLNTVHCKLIHYYVE